MAEDDDDTEQVVITGRDVFSGGAGFAPFDLSGMAAALSSWYEQAAAAAAAAFTPEPPPAAPPGLEEPETVVVVAPRPAPPPPAPPSVLDDLLGRPIGSAPPPPPPPPVTELDRLLQKPPASEFDRLLQKPRISPVLPEVTVTGTARKVVGRLLGPIGVLTLLPDLYRYGAILDDLATDSWSRRLFDEGGPDRRPAPAPRGSEPDDGNLPEVTVTGRAPRRPTLTLPTFGLVPGMGDPLGADALLAEPSPRPARRPGQLAIPLPGVMPLADPLALADPLTLTAPAPTRGSGPRDPVVAPPSDLPPRSPPRGPLAPPMTWPSGLGDPCQCPKTTKTKKRKDPRTVCYRGTYIEGSKSLKKKPLEKVSCATGKPIN